MRITALSGIAARHCPARPPRCRPGLPHTCPGRVTRSPPARRGGRGLGRWAGLGARHACRARPAWRERARGCGCGCGCANTRLGMGWCLGHGVVPGHKPLCLHTRPGAQLRVHICTSISLSVPLHTRVCYGAHLRAVGAARCMGPLPSPLILPLSSAQPTPSPPPTLLSPHTPRTPTPRPPSNTTEPGTGCSGPLLLLWHLACSRPRGRWRRRSPAERRGQARGRGQSRGSSLLPQVNK